MKIIQNRSWLIIAGLVLGMAFTRFNHFGSAVALPDASLAVFFLGGLYLAKLRGARWVFIALLVEAALIDYFAITMNGTSDWCVTPAYGFLALAYAVMWYFGNWFAPRHTLTGKNLPGLFGTAAVASGLAFVISNVSFFLFSGRYVEMSAAEYSSRVSEYLGSYVVVALMYVACAVLVHMVYLLVKGKVQSGSHAA
jgi:hypothetical protein